MATKEDKATLIARGTAVKNNIQPGSNTHEAMGQYMENIPESLRHIDDYTGIITTNLKGAANGVAELDENIRLKEEQLPNMDVFNSPETHPENASPAFARNVHISNETTGVRERVSIDDFFGNVGLGLGASGIETLDVDGLFVIDAVTGIDFDINGVNEMTIEPGQVDINNVLKILGKVNTDGGPITFDTDNPDVIDIIDSVDVPANACYIGFIQRNSVSNYQMVLIMTNNSSAITIKEVASSGSSDVIWIDNGGAISVEKTGASSASCQFAILRFN